VRTRPGAAVLQKHLAGVGHFVFDLFRRARPTVIGVPLQPRKVQDVPSVLEVAFIRNSIAFTEERGLALGEDRFDLGLCPDIEGALPALAVGVLGGVERAATVGQVTQHVVEDPARHRCVSLAARRLERLNVDMAQQCLIVQHLLEVRHPPLPIGRVAVEAAAKVVVDASGGHGVQRRGDHAHGLLVTRAVRVAQQKRERAGLRKLGRIAEPAMRLVEGAGQRRKGSLRRIGRACSGWDLQRTCHLEFYQRVGDLLRRFEQLPSLVAPGLGDGQKDLLKTGPAVHAGRRKVRPAIEGRALRSQEHRERPPT